MTGDLEVAVIGARPLSAQLHQGGPEAEAGTRRAVSQSADLMITKIRGNASGRPGPNAPTGDYRRSWNRQTLSNSGASYSVSVGTNRPQARRLEFGFIGADSLGRVYHQPAYPHVEPAIPVVAEFFERKMEAVAAQVAAGGSIGWGER